MLNYLIILFMIPFTALGFETSGPSFDEVKAWQGQGAVEASFSDFKKPVNGYCLYPDSTVYGVSSLQIKRVAEPSMLGGEFPSVDRYYFIFAPTVYDHPLIKDPRDHIGSIKIGNFDRKVKFGNQEFRVEVYKKEQGFFALIRTLIQINCSDVTAQYLKACSSQDFIKSNEVVGVCVY